MQIVVNEQYAQRRARLGTLANVVGFAALVGGLFITYTQPTYIFAAYGLLIVGLVAFNISKYNAMRWGRWTRLPRADQVIGRALKGLDNKYQLFSFLESLPADHILLTPYGVVVLEVRPFFGKISVDGDRWRRPRTIGGFLQFFVEGALGSPTRDARQNAERVSEVLNEDLAQSSAEVPVTGVVVLTHPRVDLEATDPEAPVVRAADLRTFLRRLGDDRPKLPPQLHRQIATALRGHAPERSVATRQKS